MPLDDFTIDCIEACEGYKFIDLTRKQA